MLQMLPHIMEATHHGWQEILSSMHQVLLILIITLLLLLLLLHHHPLVVEEMRMQWQHCFEAWRKLTDVEMVVTDIRKEFILYFVVFFFKRE
jgi:membrane-anchored glycerophosphoryl diester phosphodiesterase (GDPDase)